MTLHKFICLHIPSGRTWETEFNASHDGFFGDPEGVSPRTLNRIKAALIVKWNYQQPREWRYSLPDTLSSQSAE